MLGNVVELGGIFFALYLTYIAPDVPVVLLRFFLYLISWGCLVFFPHGLAHFVVGRLVGVRFHYYFLGRSAITKLKLPILPAVASRLPVLTLIVDRASLQLVKRGGRAVMFFSGAAASMIFPFFVAVASFGRLPLSLSYILVVLSAGNVIFDLYYSPKAGYISRAK